MSEAVACANAPKKRLALFLDGTWNVVGTNTNVWRLRCLCADKSTDGATQLGYYDQGVNGVAGGAWAKGLSENICEAYDWILDNYEDGDEIFIFGFSRGAFTARSLAGLITILGLLKPGGPLGVNQLYDRYRRESSDRSIYKLAEEAGALAGEDSWILKYSRETNIKMIGVWDTVGAIGIPTPLLSIPGISSSAFGFHHTGMRQPIQNAFHAVAIDEHRPKFAPTLWTVRTPPDEPPKPMRPFTSLEQRWFVGAHANVGGGCYDDLLAQIPLRWIMRKAASFGLTFREEIVLEGDEVLNTIYPSYEKFLKGTYRLVFNRSYRSIGGAPEEKGDGTHTNINEAIDASVFDRWRRNATYRPPNLASWAEQHGIDPASLNCSVAATDPSKTIPD